MKAVRSSPRNSRRSRGASQEGALFLGTKLLGELRILMRLASAANRRPARIANVKRRLKKRNEEREVVVLKAAA